MLVTGVQAVGAKGVTAIQGNVVDLKQSSRTGVDGDRDGPRTSGTTARPGEPQPVVFPRRGPAIDQRPVTMRQLQAVTRYRADGDPDHGPDHDRDGDQPDAA